MSKQSPVKNHRGLEFFCPKLKWAIPRESLGIPRDLPMNMSTAPLFTNQMRETNTHQRKRYLLDVWRTVRMIVIRIRVQTDRVSVDQTIVK